MHVLLVGILPFKAKDETSILKAISSGRVGFNRPIWKRISVQAKDLIQKILVVNPALRISPSEALAHPWLELTNNSPPAKERAVRCFSNISAFKAKEKWKKAIYRYIAAHFSASKDEEYVTKLFRYLDTNHDGMLSREELKEGTLKLFGTKVKNIDAEIDKILAETDLDESGQIDYSEFMVAAMGKREFLERHRLEEVFNSMDIDGNGFIDAEEMGVMLSRFVADDKTIEDFLKLADTNKDRRIDLPEFIKALRKS